MPTLHELDAAMLQPGRSVPAVSRLGGGTILLAAADQPWRVAGRAAAVYRLRQAGGRVVALRCPLADGDALDPGLEARYRALASAPVLAPLRAPSGPLVGDLSYVPRGLALPGHDLRSSSHPVIAMTWVMGPTVLAAADRACRAGDGAALDAMADAWAATLVALAGTGFSHGDLAADNALVRPGGGVVLVDYDTAAWPGSPDPPRAAAVASAVPGPGYAHPSGESPPLDRRDHFPALVVYASLRLLALEPALRERFGDPPGRGGGVLLFAASDLAAPGASPVFAALRGIDDPVGREIVALLHDACTTRPGMIPPLGEVVSQVRRSTRRPQRPPLRAPPRPVPAEASGWPDQLPPPPITRSPSDHWPTAPPVAAPSRPAPGPSRPRATAAAPGSPSAPERQQRLTRLNSLLLAGDEEGALRLWTESGLDRDPDAERDLGDRMRDARRRQLLRRARQAADDGDSTALLRLWDDGELDAHHPAGPLVPVVEAARRRRAQVGQLERALAVGDERAVLRLWPDLRGDSAASHVAIAAQAILAEVAGAAVAAAVADGSDEAIVASVGEAEAHGVAVDTAALRARRAAAARVRTRQALATAAADDDRPALADLALSGRLGEIGHIEPRAMRAVLRALAWPHLARALERDDDDAIIAAADDDLFAEPKALTPEQRSRIDLARARAEWRRDVRAALRQRDVATLRSALAKPPPGAEARLSRVERSRIERLSTREAAVELLSRALRDGPDSAILAALGGAEAAGAPLPAALDWAAVRGVVDRVTLADAIREAATADPPDYARLARLLPAARAAMVAGGAGLGADIDFARLEASVLGAAHLARLREALATDDDTEIASAAEPDPHGIIPRLPAAQRARVEAALRGRRR